jgi:hypothetical protein
MKKKWIILANWAISPLWFVLGCFIYYMASVAASGQVYIGVLDIIFIVLFALFAISSGAIFYFSHYPGGTPS